MNLSLMLFNRNCRGYERKVEVKGVERGEGRSQNSKVFEGILQFQDQHTPIARNDVGFFGSGRKGTSNMDILAGFFLFLEFKQPQRNQLGHGFSINCSLETHIVRIFIFSISTCAKSLR
jgi:hypothetical protein